jgi:multidrug efflux system outer membrane protein
VQSTLEAQEAAFKMVEGRSRAGLASDLALRQAQAVVESARSDMVNYIRQTAQDENALTLLAGGEVDSQLLPANLSALKAPQQLSAGMSSDVILRRPDLLQAEATLKAANANIGAARAAFFPQISLTTGIGLASGELSRLFKSGSGAWNFAPQAQLPIFDTRVWFAAKAVQAERDIAVAQYESAVQKAFREVADVLAVRGTVEKQLALQQSLVDSLSEAYRLATARYEKGIDSYLGVLDAQRSLYAAQQGLTALRLASLANQVRVFTVIGGSVE